MILNKRNNKIPYVVAIVGSLILLRIYFTSRTVGISSLGTEPIGFFGRCCGRSPSRNNCYFIIYSNWENIHHRNNCW